MKTVIVNISEIMRPADLQLRESLSTEHIEELAAILKADGKLPPVRVIRDGKSYWLWDGHHTVAAHELAGIAAVEVQITKDGTRLDARWEACSANATHGLKRTNETKRRQVEAALKLKPNESNAEIARHVHVNDTTVAAVRKAHLQVPEDATPTRTVTRGGKTFDMKVKNIGKATPAPAEKSEDPPTPEPEAAEESGSAGDSKGKSGRETFGPKARKLAASLLGKLIRIFDKSPVWPKAKPHLESLARLIEGKDK